MLAFLTKLAENPWLNFISGIILVVTSCFEIYHKWEEAKLGSHHGVAVLGLVMMLKYFPHLFHGLQQIQEGKEKKAHKE